MGNNIVVTLQNGQKKVPISGSVFKSIVRFGSKYVTIVGTDILIKKDFFSMSRVMPSVYRYRYVWKDNSYMLQDLHSHEKQIPESVYNDGSVSSLTNQNTILVVLESPHKEEYNNDFEAIAPAQGKTGRIISRKLETILQFIADNKLYDFGKCDLDVVITNPVPYQTSLYEIHHRALKGEYRKLRNDIWKILWINKHKLRTVFKQHIKTTNTRLILNCCTSMMRDEVNKILCSVDGYDEIVNLFHPIAWTFRKNISDILIKDMRFENYRLKSVGEHELLIDIRSNETYELDKQSSYIFKNYIQANYPTFCRIVLHIKKSVS